MSIKPREFWLDLYRREMAAAADVRSWDGSSTPAAVDWRDVPRVQARWLPRCMAPFSEGPEHDSDFCACETQPPEAPCCYPCSGGAGNGTAATTAATATPGAAARRFIAKPVPAIDWRDMPPNPPALSWGPAWLRYPTMRGDGGVDWRDLPVPRGGGSGEGGGFGGSDAMQDKGKTPNACNINQIWYIDAINGNDENTGRFTNEAWKTLWRVYLYLYTESANNISGFSVHPGDEFVFATGDYTNAIPLGVAAALPDKAAAGKPSKAYLLQKHEDGKYDFDYFVFQGTLGQLEGQPDCVAPAIFRAAEFNGVVAKDVNWYGVIHPDMWKQITNSETHFPFAFNRDTLGDVPGLLNASHKVPLKILNINFIGRGGGKSGINPAYRAPVFLRIADIGDLTMTGCTVVGSADAPDGGKDWQEFLNGDPKTPNPEFDPNTLIAWELYQTVKQSSGPEPHAASFHLSMSSISKGLIEGCTFAAINNSKECADAVKSWRYPAAASFGEGVALGNCNDITFGKNCQFGGAAHFALQMKDCTNIVVQDCAVHNPVHSGISAEFGCVNCVIERNTITLGGAWYDRQRLAAGSVPDNNAVNLSSTDQIVAFNFFKPDPDWLHGGDPQSEQYKGEKLKLGPQYRGDRAIIIAGVQPELPPVGFAPRCITASEYAKIVWETTPENTYQSKAGTAAAYPWLWQLPTTAAQCANTKPPDSTPSKIAGLSGRFQCAQSLAAPGKYCADDSMPQCVATNGEKSAVIWFSTKYAFDKSDKLTVNTIGGDAFRPVRGVRYDAEHFGELIRTERIAVFNNTIIDVGKSAIEITDSPGQGYCERSVRDVLVFNNIILGQRNDPSAEFLNAFQLDQQKAQLPFDPDPSQWKQKPVGTGIPGLAEPAVRGLIDIDCGGVYDGSAGVRLFCNAIGRRSTDKVMEAKDWSGKYNGKTGAQLQDLSASEKVNYPRNTLQLLTAMAQNFFKTLGNLPYTLAQHMELPRWAQIAPKLGNPEENFGTVSIAANPSDPFSTDWAVHLPTAFADHQASYRWASVEDLNAVWGLNSPVPGLQPIGWENSSVSTTAPDLTGKSAVVTSELTIAADGKPAFGNVQTPPAQPWLPVATVLPNLESSVGGSLPGKAWVNPFEPGNKFQFVDDYLESKAMSFAMKTPGGLPLPNGADFKGAVKP